MSEISDKIFQELGEMEALAAGLRAVAVGAKSQTDLENAILAREKADNREKNRRATELIDKSIAALKGIK
ncbi:MAG: hypothetical protein FWF97_04965 [Alphaproteobacteria bacterium]|nr:hypothetical protein [Alphaproteobacteria bacterium]